MKIDQATVTIQNKIPCPTLPILRLSRKDINAEYEVQQHHFGKSRFGPLHLPITTPRVQESSDIVIPPRVSRHEEFTVPADGLCRHYVVSSDGVRGSREASPQG